MVWLGRLLLLGVMALLGLGAWVSVSMVRSLPQLDGQTALPGLSAAVLVRRDASDVTHIEARSAMDVWRALGFVHAQERAWQLEFNRRLMRGQLSEVLGAATLDTDKLMRTLGIIAAAERQLARLPAATRAALQAYAEGVGAAHRSGAAGLSPEFRLLGVQPGPWTAADSVGWALMMALDLGGNWGNEAARFAAARHLSTPQLWQLMPAYPGEDPATRTDLSALYAGLGAEAMKAIGDADLYDPNSSFVIFDGD